MAEAESEYAVEKHLIEQLSHMGYRFVRMGNHDDLLTNLREQICKVNRDKLVEAKGRGVVVGFRVRTCEEPASQPHGLRVGEDPA